MPDLEELMAVTPGSDSREDVLNLLGTPSSLSTFEQNKWYYIGQKVEQFAFYRPEVIDRQVLVISFDDNGIVNQTKLLSLDDAIVVDPVERMTPTEGADLTIMEQFFGNFGRLPGAVGGETR
jgi:outer membrane protein assembly factor BamE (lipoprotein component of BamABCDE complex)